MGKYNLLILDKDIYYLKSFVSYIGSEFSNQLNAVSFSSQELIDDYLSRNPKIDIILATKEFYEDNKKSFFDKLVVIFVEDNNGYNGMVCVKKYQSAEKICEDIISIYKANKPEYEEINSETRMVSFYSPIGGIGTTTMAITVANKLAISGQKVLYLNFENIQSTGLFMPNVKSKYNFSDLILSIKGKNEDFDEVLEVGPLSYDGSNLFYFKPVESILDLEDLSIGDVKELIEKIINKNKFNYVICDLPSQLNSKFYYLFEKSLSVISILGQDGISNYKIDTMLKQLDIIKNFKFVFNMHDNSKERIVPKLVSKNLLPIIATIPYDENLKGLCDIKEIEAKANVFYEKVDDIISEI